MSGNPFDPAKEPEFHAAWELHEAKVRADNPLPFDNPTAPPGEDDDHPTHLERHRGQLRMAERMVARYKSHLRYVHGLGWYVWDVRRWAEDRAGAAMRAAVRTLKNALLELASLDGQQRKELMQDVGRCESANGLTGILKIAGSLHPMATAVDALDADPYLFNTPDGTLDLRTGELRPHDPTDLITKISGCGLDVEADGAEFDKFITKVLPDDDVRGFVQRLFGYAMLGLVREHILAILTGTGQNGKTTLMTLAQAAFGDYAITADPNLLVDRGSRGGTSGQAELRGVRMGINSETEEGQPLAAATAKRLTGGENIRARMLYQNNIEFPPSHTLFLVTNYKPKVSGDDPAMWRRIRVIPFDVTISEDEKDPDLPRRLNLALPAILRWIFAGYQEYAQRGLGEPDAVLERTKAYQVSSDVLGRFIDERVIVTSRLGKVKARELFSAWSSWCHDNGEQAGSEVDFAEAMSRRGFTKRKNGGIMVYVGLVLASDDGDEEGAGQWA